MNLGRGLRLARPVVRTVDGPQQAASRLCSCEINDPQRGLRKEPPSIADDPNDPCTLLRHVDDEQAVVHRISAAPKLVRHRLIDHDDRFASRAVVGREASPGEHAQCRSHAVPVSIAPKCGRRAAGIESPFAKRIA